MQRLWPALVAPAASAQSWKTAALQKGPMSAGEARSFIRRLTGQVVQHHMKRDGSPQRGMTYEP